jgi:hypothetical protein
MTMATQAARARLKKPVTKKRRPWEEQAFAPAGIARSVARVERRSREAWGEFVPWWKAQPDHRRLAFVAVAFVVAISVANFVGAGAARPAATASPVAPAANVTTVRTARILTPEGAPTIPGKAWVATQLWQGAGSRITESFTVNAHWRVDWLYNPPQSGGVLQVFIYSADGNLLMDMAANTAAGGPDSSFWAGPGTYFLKIYSTSGDWKLDVQDLR